VHFGVFYFLIFIDSAAHILKVNAMCDDVMEKAKCSILLDLDSQ